MHSNEPSTHAGSRKSWHRAGIAVGIAMFGAAVWLIQHKLSAISLDDLLANLFGISFVWVLAALGFSVASYLALSGYDFLGFRVLGRLLSYPKVLLASFVGFAFSHNLGFALVSGGSVRYRIYSSFGVPLVEIALVTAFGGLTFGIGATVLAGSILALFPLTMAEMVDLPSEYLLFTGWGMLTLAAGYVLLPYVLRGKVRFAGLELGLPMPGATLMQIVIAAIDLTLAAAALNALMPDGAGVTFAYFVGAFVLATTAGILSHVPGGLGVFESVLLLLLPDMPAESLFASMIAFRVIYYLVPLALAALLLAGHEARQFHSSPLP